MLNQIPTYLFIQNSPSCSLSRVALNGLPGHSQHMTAFNDEDNSDEEGNSSQECEREQTMEERREKRREVEDGDGDWTFSRPAFIEF